MQNGILYSSHGLGQAVDQNSPLLFDVGSFPVTVDTASYGLLGLAAILLVPLFVGPPSAKRRRKRIHKAARDVAAHETTLGSMLPWLIILGGGAYLLGNAKQQ